MPPLDDTSFGHHVPWETTSIGSRVPDWCVSTLDQHRGICHDKPVWARLVGLCLSLRVGSRDGAHRRAVYTATKIPFMYSQTRDCAASVPISTFVCLWAIYIFPGSINIFSCSRIGRPIAEIYKSLTDTWMWKLGLRPRNSFSENICFKFSVLCLCSVRNVSCKGCIVQRQKLHQIGTDWESSC